MRVFRGLQVMFTLGVAAEFICTVVATSRPLAMPVPEGVLGAIRAPDRFHQMNELDSWVGEPLDSRQLLAFLQLAKTGSFTLAAREMNLSQSAVSHSIRALEEAVGCRVFDRLTKKVVLTPGG